MSLSAFRLAFVLPTVALATAALSSAPVLAADAPAYAITGSSFLGTDSPVTVGFLFKAESNSIVTALGFHDQGLDGLASAHEVGLFSTGGTLLASATVAAGTVGTLVGEYRYVNLGSAYALTSGTQYVLAAHTEGSDGYRYATTPPATLALNPLISIPGTGTSGLYAYGTSLQFPAQNFGYDIYATPNMLMAVPEPGTWAMMVVGLASVGALARRRRA